MTNFLSNHPPIPDSIPTEADVVLVGAGHNALVAAAYLLDAGRSVCLLEQMTRPGGWVRTEELGAPGFHHDRWSSLHPAFVGGPAWADLGPDLRRHGLEYVTAPLATASSLPDGRTALAPVDPQAFAAELDRLGETAGWNTLFAAAGPQLPPLLGLLAAGLDSPRPRRRLPVCSATAERARCPSASCSPGRPWTWSAATSSPRSCDRLRHPGPCTSAPAPRIPPAPCGPSLPWPPLAGGNPTPVGGSGRLADALVGLVTERGGDLFCDVEVDQVLVRDGRAVGVRTSAGTTVGAREAVIVSTTPDQLYGRLLRDTPGVPAAVRTQAAGYRYRRGCFQLNLALSARPHFRDSRLDAGGALNLGRGVDALVTSVRQAGDGLLPEHPSIAWHEPTAVDPTRAPAGRAVVRLQVLDVPHTPHGDAAGTRHGTHGWDPATAEAFADRVLAEAELHVPGLAGLVLERHVTTPADLAKASPNAGPGDHAAGDNSLVQAFTQRPIPAHGGGHRTVVPGVWLIGAATWPGPSVSGASGRGAARALIDATIESRATAKADA